MFEEATRTAEATPTALARRQSRAGWRPGPLTLAAVDIALRTVSHHYGAMRRTLEMTPPALSDALSAARALRTAREAAARVPAYRRHLADSGIDPRSVRTLTDLPETDKASYVDRHALAERCVDGHLPLAGTTIDESSGSTGTPYNWVRGPAERDHVRRMISFFALEPNGLVKATGPHVEKILGTMRELGPAYRYLVVGYPPFLKLLLDEGDAQGFPWGAYTMHALLGGEGNSEGLRDYLLRRFTSVYSGYGATDVEIGLAAETPVTIRLRRLAIKRRDIAEVLFGEADRVPMVFQYNPLLHHVETNARGELLFTVCRAATLSPKVRYNVHDEGGVLRDDELRRRLAPFAIQLEELAPTGFGRLVRMPYLYVFGRKDSTVSVMGANIYPADIEAGLYAHPELAARVRSYRFSILEERPGETRPLVAIELERGDPDDAFTAAIAAAIETQLLATNRDYQEAVTEYPSLMVPAVQCHAAGTGPFAGDADRIKHRYVG